MEDSAKIAVIFGALKACDLTPATCEKLFSKKFILIKNAENETTTFENGIANIEKWQLKLELSDFSGISLDLSYDKLGGSSHDHTKTSFSVTETRTATLEMENDLMLECLTGREPVKQIAESCFDVARQSVKYSQKELFNMFIAFADTLYIDKHGNSKQKKQLGTHSRAALELIEKRNSELGLVPKPKSTVSTPKASSFKVEPVDLPDLETKPVSPLLASLREVKLRPTKRLPVEAATKNPFMDHLAAEIAKRRTSSKYDDDDTDLDVDFEF